MEILVIAEIPCGWSGIYHFDPGSAVSPSTTQFVLNNLVIGSAGQVMAVLKLCTKTPGNCI